MKWASIPEAVLTADITAAAKVFFGILALNADENGRVCLPITKLARLGQCNTDTAYRYLRELKSVALIGVIVRLEDDGVRRPSEYLLPCQVVANSANSEVVKSASGLSENATLAGGSFDFGFDFDFDSNQIDASQTQNVKRRTLSRARDFDEFYKRYPRRVGRKPAEKAWAKAMDEHSNLDDIMDGVDRYSKWCLDKEPQFVLHPATWLNQQRWRDELPVTQPRKPRGDSIPREGPYEW